MILVPALAAGEFGVLEAIPELLSEIYSADTAENLFGHFTGKWVLFSGVVFTLYWSRLIFSSSSARPEWTDSDPLRELEDAA